MDAESAAAADGVFDNLTVNVQATIGNGLPTGSALTVNGQVTVNGNEIIGSGDNLTFFSPATSGQLIDLRRGTATSPDTSRNPVVKISRTVSLTGLGGGTQSDAMCGYYAYVKAVSPCEYQPIGGNFIGVQESTAGTGNNDAMGIRGYGLANMNASGTAYGGHVEGERRFDANSVTAFDIALTNGASAESYSATGSHNTKGLRIHPSGARAACGIDFKRLGDANWDVGIAFPQNATDGPPVRSACIRTDCEADYGLMMNNTADGLFAFKNAAIAIADGYESVPDKVRNAVLIGTTSRSGQQANASLVVQSSRSSTAEPLVWLGSLQNSLAHWVSIGNSEGKAGWFVCGAAGQFLLGTAAGDTGVQILSPEKAWHVGGSTRVISVKRTDRLGFFGADPVIKQNVNGSRGGNAALASLLSALASLGLITDSTT